MQYALRLLIGLLMALMAVVPALAQKSPKPIEPKTLTVMLDWFVNPNHAPLVVAWELGLFEAQKLTVELIAPVDPNDPPKLVAAGKADLAITYQPQLYVQVNEGLPIKRIATVVATPLNSLVVLADGPIKTLADLKGRKVGYVQGFEKALLKIVLARHNLQIEDVELVNVNFSLTPALLSGQVDGVIGAFRNFELNQLDLAGKPGRAFYLEEEGIPPYDELIVVANRDKLEASVLRRFLTALEQATLYLINHPDVAWRLFIKNHPDLDNELNRRAWRDTLPRFALRPAALDNARYRRFANFLAAQGLITVALPVSNYALEVPD